MTHTHEHLTPRPEMVALAKNCIPTINELLPDLIIRQDILDAYIKHDRRDFLPERYWDQAYADVGIAIPERGTALTQPSLVLIMLHVLNPQPVLTVGVIGTGMGEVTMILQDLGMEVYSKEYNQLLANETAQRLKTLGDQHMHLSVGDGLEGFPEAGITFDRIIATAAGSKISRILMDQLKKEKGEKSILVMPVGDYDPVEERIDATLAIVTGTGSITFMHHVGFQPLMSSRSGGWTYDSTRNILVPSHTLQRNSNPIRQARQRLLRRSL